MLAALCRLLRPAPCTAVAGWWLGDSELVAAAAGSDERTDLCQTILGGVWEGRRVGLKAGTPFSSWEGETACAHRNNVSIVPYKATKTKHNLPD